MAVVAQLVRASRCGREGCRFEPGRSPIMLDFFNTRVSTLVGIIILLLVTGAVGAMICYQMYQVMNIRYESIVF